MVRQKEDKKQKETLTLGGEKVVVSVATVSSQKSTSSEEEVKKGLKEISRKALFPSPLIGVSG